MVTCREKDVSETKDQGRIEFDIIYLENNLKNVSFNFLPKTMVLKFNKDYSINSIDGFMGFISIKNISDFHNNQSITLLKFLDNKYAYKGEKNELACCFEMTDEIKISKTEEYKNITGVQCRKAIISSPNGEESFPVYYTEDINIKNPNAFTPYHEIEGVLLDFVLKLPNVVMNLKAREIKYVEIPDEEFKIPAEYRFITRRKMKEIIKRILE